MTLHETEIDGAFIIQHDIFSDGRGMFAKNYQSSAYINSKLEFTFTESYFTTSKKNVVRGMHYQKAPHDHGKLVTVISGSVVDVIVDLRRSSTTFGRHFALPICCEDNNSIYIPHGCAHGFRVLSDSAIVYYMVTSEYKATHDIGIRYDSFGYDWGTTNPIISERDQQLPLYKTFMDFLE